MPRLLENLGSVYAGSPYPDYLYACGPNHDNGEVRRGRRPRLRARPH